MALNGLLIGLSLIAIASTNRLFFFIDLTGNEVSMIRMVLLIPLFYGTIRVIGELFDE